MTNNVNLYPLFIPAGAWPPFSSASWLASDIFLLLKKNMRSINTKACNIWPWPLFTWFSLWHAVPVTSECLFLVMMKELSYWFSLNCTAFLYSIIIFQRNSLNSYFYRKKCIFGVFFKNMIRRVLSSIQKTFFRKPSDRFIKTKVIRKTEATQSNRKKNTKTQTKSK